MSMNRIDLKRDVVQRIVQRGKEEGKRAREIATELKMYGYKVFVASFCFCEGVAFFDTTSGLQIRVIA